MTLCAGFLPFDRNARERGGKIAKRESERERWRLITIEINVRAAASVGRSRRPDNAAKILAGVTRKRDAIYKP